MNSYIDFSNYSDMEILRMQREKKKEYIILIQSEKIATKLLNFYGKSLYTTNYHYRVNSEYYLLQERLNKKNITPIVDTSDSVIKIPINSIILRLIDSKNELLKINKSLYESYSMITSEIIEKINNLDISIFYQDGILYGFINGKEMIIDDDNIKEILDNHNKVKTLN